MTEEFLDSWQGFLEEVQSASGLLLSGARAIFEEITVLFQDLDSRFELNDSAGPARATLDGLRSLYESDASSLLSEIVDDYRSRRLGDRLPRAFADFRRSLDEAAGRLPVRAEVVPRELIDRLEDSTGMSWQTELVRVRNRERTVLVRAAVLDGITGVRFGQRRIEGSLYLNEARATLGLLDPWQLVHADVVGRLRRHADDDDRFRLRKAKRAWEEAGRKRLLEAADFLSGLETALSQVAGRLTEAAIRGPRPLVHRRQLVRIRACESFWSRQRLAVRSLVESETALVELGLRAVQLDQETVDGIRDEHASIMRELDQAVDALRSWEPGQADPLLPASAHLTSKAARVRHWRTGFESDVQRLIAGRLEAVDPRRPVPGIRKPWHTLEPRRLFLDAIASAVGTTESGLLAVESGHKQTLEEIDRAREVVAYSVQAIRTEASGGEQIAAEGVSNARALLTHTRESSEDLADAAEAALVEATAASFYQFLVAFERGRLSLTSHIAREGSIRAGRRALDMGQEYGRAAGPLVWHGFQRAARWSLVRIGWATPSEENLVPVETWSYFDGDAFRTRLAELPLIYDRLFRPEPVEDERFLIGRSDELAALAEAREFWKAGRFASVVIDGERGSGKTSLLNCAVAGPFAGLPIVRTSICDRLLTPRAVHEFLAAALAVDVDDLVPSFGRDRRVIIVEEAERTFLRKVDGFSGIRELLSLVADTSSSNLWVLSLTTEGCELLNRVLSLSSGFSHRLHASAVARSELQEAILQRHNLSGLRLEFAAPPGKGRLQAWIRQQTARVETAQEAFFRDLHELSGGVFRSAFATWRRQIDRVDHGVLRMRLLEVPDHSRLTAALSQKELFCLQMILQHGSLTPEEDAEIFGCSPGESHGRIERLLGHGILEPEPVVPGFRVRPEAGILVRAALAGCNLM